MNFFNVVQTSNFQLTALPMDFWKIFIISVARALAQIPFIESVHLVNGLNYVKCRIFNPVFRHT